MPGKRNHFCGSPDHVVDRRGFLTQAAAGATGLAASMTALNVLQEPALASER
jgi:hypothetical protein